MTQVDILFLNAHVLTMDEKMNQSNPHLIYPGQVLVLVKSGDRAMLQIGAAQPSAEPPSNTVKLSPRVRSQLLDNGAIATIPLNQIGPFLNEAVVFETADLEAALAARPDVIAYPMAETPAQMRALDAAIGAWERRQLAAARGSAPVEILPVC
ncbi:MAG: hypothetical protein JNJ72_20740, partial [Anaerolineales bacterium]|nr:hypothetical protein [Anaerolineales bacterium]